MRTLLSSAWDPHESAGSLARPWLNLPRRDAAETLLAPVGVSQEPEPGWRKSMGAAGWTISIIAIVIVLVIAIRELGWRR